MAKVQVMTNGHLKGQKNVMLITSPISSYYAVLFISGLCQTLPLSSKYVLADVNSSKKKWFVIWTATECDNFIAVCFTSQIRSMSKALCLNLLIILGKKKSFNNNLSHDSLIYSTNNVFSLCGSHTKQEVNIWPSIGQGN